MTQSVDILIFGAHADDAEIGMGGTIIKHVRAGAKIGICDLTLAELSSNGTVEGRLKEAMEAKKRLGIHYRSNLKLPDRGLERTKQQIDKIVIEIRKLKPKIIFAPYWQDRHPDHVMTSHMVQEAVFNAKLRRYLPEWSAVTVDQCYFYFINDTIEPDLMVDITAEQADKMHALGAYESQFLIQQGSRDQVQTPLNQGYLERVEARDRLLGQKRSLAYAEGFMSKLPFLVRLFE